MLESKKLKDHNASGSDHSGLASAA